MFFSLLLCVQKNITKKNNANKKCARWCYKKAKDPQMPISQDILLEISSFVRLAKDGAINFSLNGNDKNRLVSPPCSLCTHIQFDEENRRKRKRKMGEEEGLFVC
jgi:hypothetical protein